jgi:hypothetical protein
MSKDKGETAIGRRALLAKAGLLSLAGSSLGMALPRTAAGADEKMTQKDAEYQPTPKNGQSCAKCQLFQPPTGCKIVLGKVSPQGWCTFFEAKT